MRAVCILGYHGEECDKVRDRLDKLFAATNTSLLNIYKKCFYDKTKQSKGFKYTQSGRKLDLADFVDCDDHVGIDEWFNEPFTH